jgi:hypothetical protein
MRPLALIAYIKKSSRQMLTCTPMRFEVLTAVKMVLMVLWIVMPTHCITTQKSNTYIYLHCLHYTFP